MIIPAAMMGLPWNQTVLISFKRTLQTLITRISVFFFFFNHHSCVYHQAYNRSYHNGKSEQRENHGEKELEAKKRGRPKAWDTQETKSRPASIFPLISWRDGNCSVNNGAQNNKFNGFPGSLWYAIEKNILTKGGRIVWEKRVAYLCGIWRLGPCPAVPGPSFFLCSQPAVSLYSRDGSRDTFTSTWVRGKVLDMWLRQGFHERFSLI